MAKRVFIIDDEPNMVKMATALLQENDYVVGSSNDPEEGLKRVIDSPPDLVLLDIRMPKMDGYEVCKRLKANPHTKDVPVIIVSIRKEEADVVTGLELGADDYIEKPLRKRELLARVKAVLRRREIDPAPKKLTSGPLSLDFVTYTATLDGQPLTLNPKEFKLLAYFMRREGQVITRAAISENIWETKLIPTSRTIDTHVDFLRKKLGRFRSWIKTLKGIGYRFEIED